MIRNSNKGGAKTASRGETRAGQSLRKDDARRLHAAPFGGSLRAVLYSQPRYLQKYSREDQDAQETSLAHGLVSKQPPEHEDKDN